MSTYTCVCMHCIWHTLYGYLLLTYRPNPSSFFFLPSFTYFYKYSFTIGAQPHPLFMFIYDCFSVIMAKLISCDRDSTAPPNLNSVLSASLLNNCVDPYLKIELKKILVLNPFNPKLHWAASFLSLCPCLILSLLHTLWLARLLPPLDCEPPIVFLP